jgi:hypothetical protein
MGVGVVGNVVVGVLLADVFKPPIGTVALLAPPPQALMLDKKYRLTIHKQLRLR